VQTIYLAFATLGFNTAHVAGDAQRGVAHRRHLRHQQHRAPGLFGLSLDGNLAYYYFVLGVAVVMALLLWGCCVALGQGLHRAARQPDPRREPGRGHPGYTLLSFAIGAAYAGVAGALFASLVQFIEPAPFTVGASIMMYLMVVVGGAGLLLRAAAGSAVGVMLPEWLRFAQAWYLFVFGTAVVLLMLWLPDGLLSIPDRCAPGAWPREASDARAGGRRQGPDRSPAMTGPVLKVSGLKKAYGAIQAVGGVSFEVMPGEIFGVIGPNGSGKTTMFNSMLGQITPTPAASNSTARTSPAVARWSSTSGRRPHLPDAAGVRQDDRARQPARGRAGAPGQHVQPHVRARRLRPGRQGRRADRPVPHPPRGAQEGRRAELRPAEAGGHRHGLHERARPGAARRALRRREPQPGGRHQHAAQGAEPQPALGKRAASS
jgi:Na+-transporting methylmalonyl-CoA/oxaloacetate decarboxylase gamma subunit